MYKAKQTVVLYSPSLSLKTLDTEILLLVVFKLELEMDYQSATSLCIVAPSPTDIPSPTFSEGRGQLHTGSLKWIIHLQTVPQN